MRRRRRFQRFCSFQRFVIVGKRHGFQLVVHIFRRLGPFLFAGAAAFLFLLTLPAAPGGRPAIGRRVQRDGVFGVVSRHVHGAEHLIEFRFHFFLLRVSFLPPSLFLAGVVVVVVVAVVSIVSTDRGMGPRGVPILFPCFRRQRF